jgi:hypothetical protein
MKHTLLTILLTINSSLLFPQVILTIEGTNVIDTETEVSNGINVPRSQPTIFTFRNNSITSVTAAGYMLQAGDEGPGLNNNNLDGAVITGNKFTWSGINESSTTHGVFTGYNINLAIKYNYLKNVPNGIQRKSDGMVDTSGVIAYNIINNSLVGIVVKGMNDVKIFNNILYSEKTREQTSRGLIDIHTNNDGGLNATPRGTKIFNNIFYTKNSTLIIKVYESECLEGFESDYNLFWSESGYLLFEIGGSLKTYPEWQALGFDLHSVVMDPEFNNFNDFIPRSPLNYGKNLGPELAEGLAIDAIWGTTNPQTTYQNGAWQVGARIYEGSDTDIYIWPNPVYSSVNVLIADSPLPYQIIRFYDINGRIVLEDSVAEGINTYEIPKHISPGVYSIALISNDKRQYVKKVIILKV